MWVACHGRVHRQNALNESPRQATHATLRRARRALSPLGLVDTHPTGALEADRVAFGEAAVASLRPVSGWW